MEPSPYRPIEQRWAMTEAQLDREARELERFIGKERQDFRINYEAQLAELNEDAVAYRVQSDQIDIKKAFEERHQDEITTLLARHQLELATLQSETDGKIKQAIAEAAKTKENLKSGLKEKEAELGRNFQLRKEKLKKKREEESDKVAYAALKVIKEQARSTIEVDMQNVQSSSLSVVATPSRPVVLEPPVASPITPREGSPANPAPSTPQKQPVAATSTRQTARKLTTSTPQRQPVDTASPPQTAISAKPTSTSQRQSLGTSSASNTPTGNIETLKISTSQKTLASSPSKALQHTRTGSNAKPTASASQQILASTSSKASQITPLRPRAATPKKLPATPQRPSQGNSSKLEVRLPPKAQAKTPASVRNPLSAKSQQNNSNKHSLPSTPNQGELQRVQKSSTPPQGEKRKKVSTSNGYSPGDRVDVYDAFSSDDDLVELSSRPIKRPRRIPLLKTTSPCDPVEYPKTSNLLSAQKQNEKTTSQPAARQRGGISQSARERATMSQPPAAGEQPEMSQPRPERGISQAPAEQPTPISRSLVKQSPSTPLKASILYKTPSSAENTPSRLPQNSFEVDRVRYRRDERSWYHWQPNPKQPIAHHIHLLKGMYRPLVDFQSPDVLYDTWMISPRRVEKLEYCTEESLVKITRGKVDKPETELWVGFTGSGLKGFLTSFQGRWPMTPVLRLDASEVPVMMLRGRKAGAND